MNKKITARPGSLVKVELTGRHKTQDSGLSTPNLKKGVIRTRREADYLPRRRRPGGLIEIYDAGYVLTGENYQTHSWFRHQAQSIHPGTGGIQFENDFTLAYHQAKDVEVAATVDNSFKIVPAANEALYNLGLTIDDDFFPLEDLEYTDEGLKLTPAQLQADFLELFSPTDLFYSVRFTGEAANLITAEADPESEPVNFTLAAGDKIYLMPQVFASRGVSQVSANNPPHEDFDKYLNFTWCFFPREIYLDAEHPFFEYELNAFWTVFGGGSAWDITSEAIQAHRSFSFARAFKVDGTIPPFTTTSIPVPEFPDALFPLYPSTPTATADYTPLSVQMVFQPLSLGGPTPDGVLVGVVRRGGQTFYIWTTET